MKSKATTDVRLRLLSNPQSPVSLRGSAGYPHALGMPKAFSQGPVRAGCGAKVITPFCLGSPKSHEED